MKRFPNTQVMFRDTFAAGNITVRGINLEAEDGYIEGPADLEKDIEPHGFMRVEKWLASLKPEQRIEEAAKDSDLLGFLSRAEQAAAKERAAKQGSARR